MCCHVLSLCVNFNESECHVIKLGQVIGPWARVVAGEPFYGVRDFLVWAWVHRSTGAQFRTAKFSILIFKGTRAATYQHWLDVTCPANVAENLQADQEGSVPRQSEPVLLPACPVCLPPMEMRVCAWMLSRT